MNNNNLTVLDQREVLGVDFRVYGDADNPLFLAKDVAEWIEHTHTTNMLKHVDEDEKLNVIIVHAGQNREVTMLTEDGLYEVLMLSRKPIAKAFKKEVKKILKEVRQTGGYIAVREDESEDDVIARALLMVQNKLSKRNAELKQAEEKILIDAPKVEYYDEVLTTDACYTFTDLAKYLGLRSATQLKDILWDLKVIYYPNYQYISASKKYVGSKSKWFLTSTHAQKGYVESKTSTYDNGYGQIKSTVGFYWTEKGREFIHNLLKKKEII